MIKFTSTMDFLTTANDIADEYFERLTGVDREEFLFTVDERVYDPYVPMVRTVFNNCFNEVADFLFGYEEDSNTVKDVFISEKEFSQLISDNLGNLSVYALPTFYNDGQWISIKEDDTPVLNLRLFNSVTEEIKATDFVKDLVAYVAKNHTVSDNPEL